MKWLIGIIGLLILMVFFSKFILSIALGFVIGFGITMLVIMKMFKLKRRNSDGHIK